MKRLQKRCAVILLLVIVLSTFTGCEKANEIRDMINERLCSVDVVTQPVDVETSLGSEVVFKVAVSNTEGVTYQWYYSNDGENWAKTDGIGATTDTLTTTLYAYRVGYQYRCVVTDSRGFSRKSKAASMTVKNGGVEITSQPVDAEAEVGTDVTFKVAVNKPKEVTYQWYYSNDGQAWEKTNMASGTTDTLTVQALTYRTGYQYKCVVTDAYGNTIESNVVTLTAKRSELKIVSQPVNAKAEVGADAIFSVEVNKTEGVTYQWYYTNDGQSWGKTNMAGATTDTLTVQALAYRTGYQYKCVITDTYGNKVTTNPVTLTVETTQG